MNLLDERIPVETIHQLAVSLFLGLGLVAGLIDPEFTVEARAFGLFPYCLFIEKGLHLYVFFKVSTHLSTLVRGLRVDHLMVLLLSLRCEPGSEVDVHAVVVVFNMAFHRELLSAYILGLGS